MVNEGLYHILLILLRNLNANIIFSANLMHNQSHAEHRSRYSFSLKLQAQYF